eukprot:TRINITY_DN422_c0_g1_i2.p1 TRINITY_DN422_c0_g1~~TRINITY_DN422_c0_g1_i2.p1  ORF type:complete len:736 (-),score=167.61 TRINITY_DN422_c0_g1_i2:147-2354(-)
MKAYLFLYNILASAGWAYVLFLVIQSWQAGLSAAELWKKIEFPLQVVQTSAALEIVHSLVGLVRSPVVATLMQVSSRLGLLWLYTSRFAVCQAHWSLYLMAGSWALVEVPRYLFYAMNLFVTTVPYPLFFLRYSLFMILYPSGISGELLQIWTSLPVSKRTDIPFWYLSWAILLLYVPGSPFMYFHMLAQRKRAAQNRAQGALPPKKENGLVFPPGKRGDRSTTEAGKEAFGASLDEIDKKLADTIRRERDWRFGYNKHVVNSVRSSLSSPENSLKSARAGLKYLHENFQFIRDGKTTSFAEAMKNIEGTFHTGIVKGTAPVKQSHEYVVPYKGQQLKGDALIKQLDKWVAYGTIEPEARDAIAYCVKNPGKLDLSDRYFVLIGAGSAMGPFYVLSALGANIIAVDINRNHIWKRLIEEVRKGSGSITFPLNKPQSEIKNDEELYQCAGGDLFTQTPEIKNWLLKVHPDKPITVGGYAYLDGALHVQVSLAMDAIMEALYKNRKNVSLAYLCSPTDVFVIPDASRDAMVKNLQNAPLWQKIISAVTGGRLLQKNALSKVQTSSGASFSICDGLVVAQGPNYALAKRLQHWRAIVARADGSTVSTNIAPSTATLSVVHNKQFAAAYGGMYLFKPMEIMYQETSNAVMGALLLHDVINPDSTANPTKSLRNPLELFSFGAFHGGIWRCAYKINSIGEVAALSYYLDLYKAYLATFSAGVAAFAGYAYLNGLPKPHTW